MVLMFPMLVRSIEPFFLPAKQMPDPDPNKANGSSWGYHLPSHNALCNDWLDHQSNLNMTCCVLGRDCKYSPETQSMK